MRSVLRSVRKRKDQVTHGHIRRVQIYATRLAQEITVSNLATN